jgi:hypothetical protein
MDWPIPRPVNPSLKGVSELNMGRKSEELRVKS